MGGPGEIPFTMADFGEILLAVSERARIGLVITSVSEGLVCGVYLSDSAVEIFGHPREELMRKNLLDLCTEEERPRVAELVRRISNRETVDPFLETTVVQANGRQIALHVTLVEIVHGGRTYTVNLVRDVTERRNAERAIAKSQERFRDLIEAVPEAIFVIDRADTVVYANRAAVRLLGYGQASEIVGQATSRWFAPEDVVQVRKTVAQRSLGESTDPCEYRMRKRDGTQIVVECSPLPIEFEGSSSLVVFGRDVTERRRMQEHLARTDRLAALGRIAAGVAHEINNPLGFMTLHVDALDRLVATTIPSETTRTKLLDVIAEVRSGAARVASIVRDLRMFSRADEVEDSAVDIARVIASAQRLVMHELRPRARVVVELPPLPTVKASASRLEQVFVNLLLNAAQSFEAASERNEVRVTGGRRADGSIYVDVSDNGPGIPREVLGRIFDPFFTTKPVGVGTGLGLSICHGIISRVGGELTVESEVGRGTTFRVVLAAHHAPTPPASTPDVSPNTPRRGRILIVDDEPAIGQSMRALLQPEHDVDVVTSGETALERLLAGDPYDVVFCDLTMRGVGGAEVYTRIAEARPGLEGRIVFMTGDTTAESARTFLARVPNIRIEKPFSATVLDRSIRVVMGA